MSRFLLALFSALAMLHAQERTQSITSVNAARKIALVIGNSAYRNTPLTNPANDARDVGLRLRELGFDTEVVLDASGKQMDAAVNHLVQRIGTGAVALFYYAGHGAQIDDENYLIPVDFVGQDDIDVRHDTISANKIQERMENSGAQLKIIVLDACRNNPYRRSTSRDVARGLAAMNPGRGTFVAFAASPGHTANENPDGRNGLFTQYFLEVLRQPGLGLDDVFNVVRERVDQSSGGKQLPWSLSSVIGRFTFVSGNAAPLPASVIVPSAPKVDANALYDRAFALQKAKDYAAALPIYRQAAEAGDTNAMNNLGGLYQFGEGVTLDYSQAMQWYRKAADLGNAYGMANVGGLYEYGGGVTRDYGQAMQWYRKAADAGNAGAMDRISWLYYYGLGVKEDIASHIEWKRKAAAAGNADAMLLMGRYYESGYGVEQDRAAAIEWYRKAAAAGNDAAKQNLKRLEAPESEPISTPDASSVPQVNAAAMFARAEELYNAEDYAAALPLYSQAAGAGSADAIARMTSIGHLYENRFDEAVAMRWYRVPADAGDKNAMFAIGLMYENGKGVNEDRAEAMRWYRKAAGAGDKNSMFRIGLMYGNGWGVKRSYEEAVRWYRKAADAGDAGAMFQVGESYEKGMGVAKNKAEAIAWYEKCAAAGDVIGKEALKRLGVKP